MLAFPLSDLAAGPNHDPSIVLCDLADADTLQIFTNDSSKFLSSCHYQFCA